MIKQGLRYLKHDVFEYYYFLLMNTIQRKKESQVLVASIEETIDKVINDRVSVSRFGDGEFLWIIGKNQNSFQEGSESLSNRLHEVIQSDNDNHIVCLTDAFGSLKQYNHFSIRFWARFMTHYRKEWTEMLKPGKQYYNTNITRLYMDYKDKSKARQYYDKMKLIWVNRELVIVEGEYSRLGVGNDLFDGASSIKRILAPAVNAFSKYDQIISSVKKNVSKDKLILIALGPTATILAYDLAHEGYQALDVGHLDVEYEWMKMGATEKVPIKGKYVNEAKDGMGRVVENAVSKKYYEEIVERIE